MEIEQGRVPSGAFELGFSIAGMGTAALVIGSSIYYPRTFSTELRQSLKLAFVVHRGFAKAAGELTQADFALDLILADIDHVRKQLSLGPVVIVGHSGHAYLALEFAKRYPKNVTHVVLIAAGPSQSAKHLEVAEQYWQEAVCPERKAQCSATPVSRSAAAGGNCLPEKYESPGCVLLRFCVLGLFDVASMFGDGNAVEVAREEMESRSYLGTTHGRTVTGYD